MYGLLGIMLSVAAPAAPAVGVRPPANTPAATATATATDTMAAAAGRIDALVEPQKAFDAWTGVVAAMRAERPQRPTALADAMRARADTMLSLSQTKESIAEAEAALALLGQGRDADVVRAGIYTVLGNGADGQSEWPKALDYHRRAMELRAKLFGVESLEAAISEADVGLELTKLSQHDAALKALEHSFAVQSRLSPPGDMSRLLAGTYLSNIYYSTQRRTEAVDLMRRLIADGQALGPTHPLMAQMVSELATSLSAIGRPIEAMAVHRANLDALRAKNMNKSVMGDALMGATMVSLQLDRPAETEAYAAAAAQSFEQFGQPLSAAAALSQAANAARQLDRPQLALERADKSVAIAKGLPQPVPMAIALFEGTQANAQAANGRIAEALALQQQAYDVIAKGRPPGHPQRTYAEIELGWLTALNGDPKAGVARIRPIVESIVSRNRTLEIAQTRVVPISSNLESFSQAMEAAYRAGDTDFGFFLAQVLTESDAGRATLATLAKLSARDPATATRLDRRRELLGERVDLDSQRLLKITDAAAVAALDARIAPIDREVASIEVALKRDFPDFDSLLRPAPEQLAAVRQRLRPGETLLIPVTTHHGLYTFALTRDGVAWGRSALSRTGVRALIERVRLGLPFAGTARGGTGTAATAAAFDRAAASDLYDAIFTPDVARLTRKASLLTIAADDVISTIPLSLLPTGRGGHAPWLIERVAMRVAPSIAALGRPNPAPGRTGGFVGVGAPAQLPATTTTTLAKALADLPPLPGTERELRAMDGAIGGSRGTLLTGANATETRLRESATRDVRVLVFATHGLVSGEFDSLTEPALVLAPDAAATGTAGDGLLTASEAATLDLNAEWVVLSACNTAAGDQLSASGYAGLARAFLFAGGQQILASHWPVQDDIAARLTVETVRAARAGRTGPEALRGAIVKLMHDRTIANAGDPALWAPFMLVSR